MNISQAKELPLDELLQRLGFTPAKVANGEIWYNSPFRPDEKTPSFKVSASRKAWIDFGDTTSKGGNIIDFALRYFKLADNDVSGALRELRSCSGNTVANSPKQRTPRPVNGQEPLSENTFFEKPAVASAPAPRREPRTAESEPGGLTLHAVYEFSQWSGKGRNRNFSPQAQYLASRGLNPTICAPYVHTVKFAPQKDPKKSWYGLGFKNDAGGYELRAKFGQQDFKGVVGAHKEITYIKPPTDSHRLHIFEGFTDFLTALHILPAEIDPKDEHFLILNGAKLVERAKAVIERNNYSTLILWNQHDPTGQAVEAFFLKLPDELPQVKNVGSMGYLYDTAKDLNEWFASQPTTSKPSLEKIQSIVSLQIGSASYDIFNRHKPM